MVVTILIVYVIVLALLWAIDYFIVLTREPIGCTGSEGYE